jgi:hypothetical protein
MNDLDVDYKTIQSLAYHLWQERGSPIGSPDEDWFHAQRELHQRRTHDLSLYAFAMGPVEE